MKYLFSWILCCVAMVPTVSLGLTIEVDNSSQEAVAQFTGNPAKTNFGTAIAHGDFDNDGNQDLAVGYTNDSGTGEGGIYIYYGTLNQIIDADQAATLDYGEADEHIYGGSADDFVGATLAVGDFDNDGYDDLAVGVENLEVSTYTDAGGVYILEGSATGLISSNSAEISTVDEALLSGSASNMHAGYSVAVYDLDNDRYDDLIVGAPGYNSGLGRTFVNYGSASGIGNVSYLFGFDAAFTGESSSDESGYSIAVGDLNGDNYGDIIVGARFDDDTASNSGAAYIIYGSASDFSGGYNLSASDAKVVGESASDSLGTALAVGDVDGDGNDEVLIGGSGVSSQRGRVYAYYGSATELTGTLNAGGADVEWTGDNSTDLVAIRGSLGVGDFNGDSFTDILIGAKFNDASASNAGAVYVVLGNEADYAGSLSVDSADYTFLGSSATEALGLAVSVFDSNNDGYNELFMGAPFNDDEGSNVGAVYTAIYSSDIDADEVLSSVGVVAGTDCNDLDDSVFVEGTYYADLDGDGYGRSTISSVECTDGTPPTGYADNAADCDDTSASAHTEATYYEDADSDGYGNSASSGTFCPSDTEVTSNDYVLNSTDCNDGNASVFQTVNWYIDGDRDGTGGLLQQSVCSGASAPTGYSGSTGDACDADAETTSTSTYYEDTDSDGYGDAESSGAFCPSDPEVTSNDYVDDATDCDDTSAELFQSLMRYVDTDGDGTGSSTQQSVCMGESTPSGYSETTGDQCDSESSLTTPNTYYEDSDGDGFGNSESPLAQCATSAPTGYVSNDDDVDDTDASITDTDPTQEETEESEEDNSGGDEEDSNTDNSDNGDTENSDSNNDSEISEESDEVTVRSVTPLTNNRVRVTYSDGSTQTITAFANGSTKPRVKLSNDGERIIVLKKNGKVVRIFDAQTGEQVRSKKIRNATQSRAYLKTVQTHGQEYVVAVTKKGNTIRTTLMRLTDTNTLKNVQTKRYSYSKSNFKVQIRNGRIRIKTRSGNVKRVYKITRRHRLKKV